MWRGTILSLISILTVLTHLLFPSASEGEWRYCFNDKWGREGSGDGQFDEPKGIAIDSLGYAYVTDSDDHQVQKFRLSGSFVTKWGIKGAENGHFDEPQGIAVDKSGNVYVADTDNHRIQKFMSSGEFLKAWGTRGAGDGQFRNPRGIAVDSSGNVYVADTDNDRIQKFDLDGTYIQKWGTSGSSSGEFDEPEAIAVGPSGRVYVADTDNKRIQKFTSSGGYIEKWGAYGSGEGQFVHPAGIAVDSSGYVYVTDVSNHCVQKFTSDGEFVIKWGERGRRDGTFKSPQGIAVDGDGYVYVVDSDNYRVQVFEECWDAPPEMRITSELGLWVRGSMNIEADASDDGSIKHVVFYYSLDNSTWHEIFTDISTPYSAFLFTTQIIETVDKSVWFRAKAVDDTDQEATDTKKMTHGIDNQLPATEDDYDGKWHNQDFYITLSADDKSGSGISSIIYKLNDGTENTKSGNEELVVTTKVNINTESGNNKIEYWSIDVAGNSDVHHTVSDMKLDKTVPTTRVQIQSSPDGKSVVAVNGWYPEPIQLKLLRTDTTSGIDYTRYNRGGGGWQTYSSPISLPEGETSIEYYSVDRAANKEADKVVYLKVDSKKPTANVFIPDGLSEKGEDDWYISKVIVDITSSDGNGSGVESEHIRLFGNSIWQKPPMILETDGIHKVVGYAMDQAGLRSSESSVSVKVDRSKPFSPEVTCRTHIVGEWSNKTSIEFAWTRPVDTSGISGYSCILNRSSDAIPGEAINRTTESGIYTIPEDATNWYFHVRARDNAGWWSDKAGHFGPLKIDTVPPTTTHSVRKNEETGERYIRLSATDGDSGVIGIRYKLGTSALYGKNTIPKSSFFADIPLSAELCDTITYYSIDQAGNKGEEKEVYICQCNVRFLLDGVSAGGSWYRSAVQVTLLADDCTIRYNLDDDGWQDYSSPFSISSEGRHIIQYYATDSWGNTGDEQILNIGIDTTEPVTIIVLDPDRPNGENSWYISPVKITLDAEDKTSGVNSTEYRINEDTWQEYSEPFEVSENMKSIIVEWRSTDNLGNREEPPNSISISMDLLPPGKPTIEQVTHPKDVWVADSLIYFSWLEPADISGIQCYSYALNKEADTIPDEECMIFPPSSSYTTPIADGIWYFYVRALDNAGRWGEVDTYGPIKIDTEAPEFLQLFHTPVDEDTDGSLIMIAELTDHGKSGIPNAPKVDYRMDDDAYDGYEDMEADGELWTFEVAMNWSRLSGQTLHYRVKAFDGVGNWTEEEKIEYIDPKADPPVVQLTTGIPSWVKGTVRLEASAEDSDEDLTVAIFGYSLDAVQWHGIGSDTKAPYVVDWDTTDIDSDSSVWVKVVAEDSTGLSDESVSDSFGVDNEPPNTIHDYDGQWYGGALTITFTANDGDGIGVFQTSYRLDGGNVHSDRQVEITTAGMHKLEYWSIDRISNVETHKFLNNIGIDKTRPIAALKLSGKEGDDGWYTSPVEVTLTAQDPSGSGVKRIIYRHVGHGSWQYYQDSPFQVDVNGENRIEFYSVDVVGNQGLLGKQTFWIDTLSPEASIIISGGEAPNGWYSSNIEVSCSASDPTPGSGVSECYVRTDDEWQNSPITIQTEGENIAWFYAKDKAGNMGIPESRSINIDKTPPDFSGWVHEPEELTKDTQGIFMVKVTINDELTGVSTSRIPQFTYKITGAYRPYEDMRQDVAGNWFYAIQEDWKLLWGETLTYKVLASDDVGNEREVERDEPIRRPIISIDPDSIDFGVIWIDQAVEEKITVYNTGDADLILRDISINARDVTLASSESDIYRPIPADGERVISIRLVPSDVFGFSGSITLESNAPDLPPTALLYARFPAPEIVGLSPSSGKAEGGTNIAITGLNFASSTTVKIGEKWVIPHFESSKQLLVKTPGGEIGEEVEVLVRNNDSQQFILENGFMYQRKSSITVNVPDEVQWDSVVPVWGTAFDAQETGFKLGNIPITLSFFPPDANIDPMREVVTTTSSGNYSFTFTSISPETIGPWRVEANWAGDFTYESTKTDEAVDTFWVTKVPTRLEWDENDPTEIVIVDSKTVYIRGMVEPSPGEVDIKIAVTPPEGSPYSRSVRTNSSGIFTLSQNFNKVGLWNLVSSWGGNGKFEGGKSSGYTPNVVPNQPPVVVNLSVTVSPSNLYGDQTNKVSVNYTLWDKEGDTLDIKCLYGEDGGGLRSSKHFEGRMSGITTGLYTGSITWNSRTDIPSASGKDVRIGIVPMDTGEGQPRETGVLKLVNLLGDYDDDGDIDLDDKDTFEKAWYDDDMTKDIGSEQSTGTVPDMTPVFDGKLDFEDLAIFIMMWNYMHNDGVLAAPALTPYKDAQSLFDFEIGPVSENARIHHVTIGFREPLYFLVARIALKFDPHKVQVLWQPVDSPLNETETEQMLLYRLNNERGILEIQMGRLGAKQKERKKLQDTLLSLELEKLVDDGVGIQFSFDLRDDLKHVVARGQNTLWLSSDPIPSETKLMQNYPNPFNPETWIPYQLARDTSVTICIYTVEGQLVRTLDLGEKPAGMYLDSSRAAYWDGKNGYGEAAASGVYFYILKAGSFGKIKKLSIVR